MKSTQLALLCTALFLTPAIAEDSVVSLLPAKLHDATGKEIDAASLEGKTVALYFSAHWCPPCRAFTPSLVEFRDKHAEDDFEIVFVSFDNSDDEKSQYIEETEMKWLTLAGTRSAEGNALAEKYGIQGIPALIVLAPDGSLVTAEGRNDVSSTPDTALEKWKSGS